jgi:hypothetical protein
VIIEMRTYKTLPGKRTEFLEIFESKSMPAHQEIGMKARRVPSIVEPDVQVSLIGERLDQGEASRVHRNPA